MPSLKAIVPSSPIKYKAAFQDAFIKTFDECLNGMKADYKKTTEKWQILIAFNTSRPEVVNGGFSASVGTDNPIYGYVDLGTKPHIIRAKRAKYLRFRGGYSPRTQPNKLASGASSRSGSWVQKQVVHHPGNKPRNFSQIIQLKWQTEFETRLAKRVKAITG